MSENHSNIPAPVRRLWRASRAFSLALAGTCLCGLSALTAIPPRPADGDFFHDLAHVINATDTQSIQQVQQEVFRRNGTPIVVVTIDRMHDYDPESPSVESFARRWFDSWGIGSQEMNVGMLVLVSTGDRKARIELGADWGGRFDGFCRQLMDKKMVPQFKEGNYGKGLIAAVSSLAEIAEAGPRSEPPSPGLTERILDHPVLRFSRESNPIAQKGGPLVITLMVIAGLGCMVASIFLPQYRKPLLIGGLLLLGLALLFWIVVLLLFVFGRSGAGDSGGFSSGGFGGGGFGGGSSGGGGASGSW